MLRLAGTLPLTRLAEEAVSISDGLGARRMERMLTDLAAAVTL